MQSHAKRIYMCFLARIIYAQTWWHVYCSTLFFISVFNGDKSTFIFYLSILSFSFNSPKKKREFCTYCIQMCDFPGHPRAASYTRSRECLYNSSFILSSYIRGYIINIINMCFASRHTVYIRVWSFYKITQCIYTVTKTYINF